MQRTAVPSTSSPDAINWGWVRFHIWQAVRDDDPKHLRSILFKTAQRMGQSASVYDLIVALQTQMWRESNHVDRTGQARGGVLVVAATNGAAKCVQTLVHIPQPADELENAVSRAKGIAATEILKILEQGADWRATKL